MQRIAVFPGSFDPIHKGHVEIVKQATPLFDKIIIAIGINSSKKYLLNADKRMSMIAAAFSDNNKIEIKSYSGLTVNFCKDAGANFILRGLRTSADFEFEKAIAHSNRLLAPSVETVFFLSSPDNAFVSSSIIREIISNGGDVSGFLPGGVNNQGGL